MTETAHSDSVMAWVKRQRFTNMLEYDLMADFFDLDGALAAGQIELAWRVRQRLLTIAVELYLLRRAVDWAKEVSRSDQMTMAAEALERINPELADEVWGLLLGQAPTDPDEMRVEVERTLQFVRRRLDGVPVTREDAIRAWADGTRLLRAVAESVGLAGSDAWYLNASAPSERLSWYDEVLGLLSDKPERIPAVLVRP